MISDEQLSSSSTLFESHLIPEKSENFTLSKIGIPSFSMETIC